MTQKTVTIQGVKLTASQIKNAKQSEAKGGHNIASIKGLEIHWMEWPESDEVHIFNAGSVQRDDAFGAKVVFLEA
jgi:hypothetical protein